MRKLRSIYVDVIVELFYKEKTTNYIHIHIYIYINTREYIYMISIFDTILKKRKTIDIAYGRGVRELWSTI